MARAINANQTERRIGKINYVVGTKYNEFANETIDTKIEKLVRRRIHENISTTKKKSP